MRVKLIAIGKTDNKNLVTLIETYQKRLRRYISFSFEIISDIKNAKNLNEKEQKEKEGELILKKLHPTDTLVLLDEKGTEFTSVAFAKYLQKKMNMATKQLVLVIGGPYGFSEQIYAMAKEKIAFSKMTFSHQMIRLFVVEQIYRGFTILKNEPYHHQ